MEELVGTSFGHVKHFVRKKRTRVRRRPQFCLQNGPEPYSDDLSKVSSDENAGDGPCSSSSKVLNLGECVSRAASFSKTECVMAEENINGTDARISLMNGKTEKKHHSQGVLAPANWKSMGNNGHLVERQCVGQSEMTFDGLGNENKVKKVKLKVGGVTHTIQANSATNGVLPDEPSSKNSLSSDVTHEQKKLNLMDNSIGKRGLQGVPWKDFSFSFHLKEGSLTGKSRPSENSEPVRKRKWASKRQAPDGALDDSDEDDDDEIRYLEKLKNAKLIGSFKDDVEEPIRKHRSVSKISRTNENLKSSGKYNKKNVKFEAVSDDVGYEQVDLEVNTKLQGKRKTPKNESIRTLMEGRREMTLTKRQRALQSGKDSSDPNLIEFPNGLPAAHPRRQKEKLTDLEQQLKKAEAAERRKVQVEKAARECEAEAIRKILGQDSSRKKREDKLKKRREELAQEKASNANVVASSTIRWVMGPAGTTVTFSSDMGLPSIFDSKPCSYPPPREICAGPSCSNPYKYRDSKLKLPLCSLQCYKAVQGKDSG